MITIDPKEEALEQEVSFEHKMAYLEPEYKRYMEEQMAANQAMALEAQMQDELTNDFWAHLLGRNPREEPK